MKLTVINLLVKQPATANMLPLPGQYKEVIMPLPNGMPFDAVSAPEAFEQLRWVLEQCEKTPEFDKRDPVHVIVPDSIQGKIIWAGILSAFEQVTGWFVTSKEMYIDFTDATSIGRAFKIEQEIK